MIEFLLLGSVLVVTCSICARLVSFSASKPVSKLFGNDTESRYWWCFLTCFSIKSFNFEFIESMNWARSMSEKISVSNSRIWDALFDISNYNIQNEKYIYHKSLVNGLIFQFFYSLTFLWLNWSKFKISSNSILLELLKTKTSFDISSSIGFLN